MALVTGCGEVSDGKAQPDEQEQPQVHECLMPSTVCAATIACDPAAVVEDCGTEIDPASAELRGHVGGDKIGDPDADGWVSLAFDTGDGTYTCDATGSCTDPNLISGVEGNSTRGHSTELLIQDAGRWLWVVHTETLHAPTEIEIQVETGCGLLTVSGCLADDGGAALSANEPFTFEQASPAIYLEVGSTVSLRARNFRQDGHSTWLEARRAD